MLAQRKSDSWLAQKICSQGYVCMCMCAVMWENGGKLLPETRTKSVKRSRAAWGIPFVPGRWYSISGTHIFIIITGNTSSSHRYRHVPRSPDPQIYPYPCRGTHLGHHNWWTSSRSESVMNVFMLIVEFTERNELFVCPSLRPCAHVCVNVWALARLWRWAAGGLVVGEPTARVASTSKTQILI